MTSELSRLTQAIQYVGARGKRMPGKQELKEEIRGEIHG